MEEEGCRTVCCSALEGDVKGENVWKGARECVEVHVEVICRVEVS